MTNPINRELNVGLVHYQGKSYEAVMVYQGDAQNLPAAFSAVHRANEIYRRSIQMMLDQPEFVTHPEPDSIVQLSHQGAHFNQDNQIIGHPDVQRWKRLVASLIRPDSARVPPVRVTIEEYQLLKNLYERLPEQPASLVIYTDEEKRLLAKLEIPVKNFQDPGYGDFRFKVFAKYLAVEQRVVQDLDAKLHTTL